MKQLVADISLVSFVGVLNTRSFFLDHTLSHSSEAVRTARPRGCRSAFVNGRANDPRSAQSWTIAGDHSRGRRARDDSHPNPVAPKEQQNRDSATPRCPAPPLFQPARCGGTAYAHFGDFLQRTWIVCREKRRSNVRRSNELKGLAVLILRRAQDEVIFWNLRHPTSGIHVSS